MLVFCWYFVVYSAIPQKGTALIVCIYRCVFMCLCFCVTLTYFFTFLGANSDPVSVCLVLYVIILIQILIRCNVQNLITACTRSLDFYLKN